MKHIGRVESIWRHPVKSMRGERVSESELRWPGLAGDRRYAFVRGDDTSRFPWLTGRQIPVLLRYRPFFVDPSNPNGSAVRVATPSGRELAVDDAALLAEMVEAYGAPVQFLHSGRGLHDASPVSLIGRATVEALCRAQGVEPEERRFRNNLVISVEQGAAFEEDGWIGRELQLGPADDAPRLRVDRKNERCVMITIEPETLEKTPSILSTLARERQACAGIYASVVRPGWIRAGAEILAIG